MAKKQKVNVSKKIASQPSKTKRLLTETDRLAYISSVLFTILLGVGYFTLWGWQTTQANEKAIREFSLSIITNLIPVFLLFAFSYALFRRIQSIKAEEEQEELALGIVNEMQNRLEEQLPSLFTSEFSDISNRLELLAKTADFAGRKEELADLQRVQQNLRNLEDNISRHTRVLNDTLREEFLSLSKRFRDLEEELKDLTIKDVRKTLERELQALQLGLDTQKINELSGKIANSVEQSIQKVEEDRIKHLGKEIDNGFTSIQSKVNETVTNLNFQQKELSKNIIEKIDNHQDVITFVTEIRGERDELLSIMWKNVQDEFTGEIKQGLSTPKEMIVGKLTKDLSLSKDQADEIASDLTKTFLVFLSDALGRMQKERFDSATKKPSKRKKKQ